jgi:glutaredoxin
MNRDDSNSAPRPLTGSLSLVLGIGLLSLILLDTLSALPWAMPQTWYRHKALWGAIGLMACAAGWYWQRARAPGEGRWKPTIAGRRFHRLIVYSRADCHLCDDAKAVLADYLEYLPEIREIDVDADPELKDRFDAMVPVVELDGQLRFHGRVDEILLRRLIEATPPIS